MPVEEARVVSLASQQASFSQGSDKMFRMESGGDIFLEDGLAIV